MGITAMSESLIYRGCLEGHRGWVTGIATTNLVGHVVGCERWQAPLLLGCRWHYQCFDFQSKELLALRGHRHLHQGLGFGEQERARRVDHRKCSKKWHPMVCVAYLECRWQYAFCRLDGWQDLCV